LATVLAVAGAFCAIATFAPGLALGARAALVVAVTATATTTAATLAAAATAAAMPAIALVAFTAGTLPVTGCAGRRCGGGGFFAGEEALQAGEETGFFRRLRGGSWLAVRLIGPRLELAIVAARLARLERTRLASLARIAGFPGLERTRLAAFAAVAGLEGAAILAPGGWGGRGGRGGGIGAGVARFPADFGAAGCLGWENL
jgi:hypothetical protein